MTEFGTMEDFDRLLAEAHSRGMKIVMDLVVNHTSDEHAWFVESRRSKDNPYRDFYIWKEPRNGREPNNWRSCFSGSAWEYCEETGMYYLHLFSKKQPDLNWENPQVRREVYDMMTWWCEKGIDGFRMDVVSFFSKDQRFPDGAVAPGEQYGDFSPYVINGPRIHEFLQEMNREVLSKYDLLTVGEAGGVTIDEAKKYAAADGSELGMVFHFEHTDGVMEEKLIGKWDCGKPRMPRVRQILNKWQLELEGKAWGSLYWDNHDQPRVVSRFGNESPRWRVLSAKMLATCLHMQKGTPYIYQGEELAMTNAPFTSLEDCRDIEEINAYRQYVTEESGKWLRFAASNTTESDLELLQRQQATVDADDYFPVATDTLRVVRLKVENYLSPTALGEASRQEEEGVFEVTVVKRADSWQVRMEGLPRSEKQSRD